ncbi:MAG: hypothetical protein ABI840_12235 [bacterium]
MALDKNQIKIIKEAVDRASLVLEDLRDELIDHLCCEIEVMMDNGESFESAYERIKQSVTIGILQTIEENTFKQIDKKYSLMKNLMKISGNISLILITTGTIMKLFSINGSTTVLTFAFTILCLLFLPLALYTYRPDPVNHKNQALKISIFLSCLFFSAGILFRTMNWQGANVLLAITFIILLFVVLPFSWLLLKRIILEKSDRQVYLIGIFSLAIFIVGVAFKMFYFPASAFLLTAGSILLVSVFLPLYTYREFKRTNNISARFIYLIIATIYVVTMVILMSFGSNNLQNLITKN